MVALEEERNDGTVSGELGEFFHLADLLFAFFSLKRFDGALEHGSRGKARAFGDPVIVLDQ